MPITDPVPDDAIVQGFKSLRDHHTDDHEGHGHSLTHPHPTHPSKPPPPPRSPNNEVLTEHKDHNHEGSTGETHHHDPKANEENKHLKNDHEISTHHEATNPHTKQNNAQIQPTPPTPPLLSPFPDIDIFLLNDSKQQHQQQQPVPKSQGSKSIIEILATNAGPQTAPLPENLDHPADKKHEHRHIPGLKDMIMVDVGHLGNQSYHHHDKHPDETAATAAATAGSKEELHSGSSRNLNSNRGGEKLKGEVLEKALIAQWPPLDQKNHAHVDAYERLGRDGSSSVIGGGGGDTVGRERRRGFKNWFRPSVWLDRKFYKVSINLKTDWRVQATFFAKLILTKATQLLLINLWMLLLALLPDVRETVVEHHDWMYLPLGIFLLILISVRIISKSKAGWFPLLALAVLIVVTMLLAYALAAVTFAYKAYCIPMVTVTLFLTCITLPFVPFMTQTAATQPVVIRIGGVLVLVYAVFILVVVAYSKQFPDMAQFATLIWFPGLLMAEIVLWVTIYEIQHVIGGYCFNVSERRWCFTALYV